MAEPTAEARLSALIEAQVQERADHVRAEQEATQEIARLCAEARRHGVAMARLAELVKVVDPKTGELRSVSRQAVDQLVAAHEQRPRAPRRAKKATSNGKINMAALGG